MCYDVGMNLLEGLNDNQLKAVTTTEGYVRVIASAGSGKTRALTHRFAYLVCEMGILPSHILCVTFTNKAAQEMRTRIHNLTGDNDTGYIDTFHGFCVCVLQEEIYHLGYPKSFLVLDNSDIDAMLRIIYEERGLSMKDMTFSAARDMIEMQKLFYKPDYYEELQALSPEEIYAKYMAADEAREIIFYGYLYQEKKVFALDYNDLIIFTIHLFKQFEDSRLKWQQRIEYIMIDEFQDIDRLQCELMNLLAGYHHNLFIVGDPDQTIYTWRGASVKYILDFDKEYSPCETIVMSENYRSSRNICKVADRLISHNTYRYKKDLVPLKERGSDVLVYYAPNFEEQALWVADEIGKLHDNGVSYKDIAVLYRAHYVTRDIEAAFLDQKVPFAIYSGVGFYDREEIKDALSYLRMIVYRDDLSLRRIINTPKRNLGKRRMEFLEEAARRDNCTLYQALGRYEDNELFKGTGATKFIQLIESFSSGYESRPISDVLEELLHKSGYEKLLRTEGSQNRLDNLAELKQQIHNYEISCGEECTLENYLNYIALISGADMEYSQDQVKLMTVHAAKGLEFPYVFLVSMNEGVFPTRKTDTRIAMEEERRLAFVAVTRAMEGLFVSEADGRNFDGSPRYPSRFLIEMVGDVIEPQTEGVGDVSAVSESVGLIYGNGDGVRYVAPPREGLIAETKDYVSVHTDMLPEECELSILPVNTRIKHKIMGLGTIIDYNMDHGSYVIQFDDIETRREISFRTKVIEELS